MKITDTTELRINDIVKSNKELKRNDFNYKININKLDQFEFDFKMEYKTKNLLKRAIEQLEFSVEQLMRLEKITKGIMVLDNSSIAKEEHIAEAIQYVNC